MKPNYYIAIDLKSFYASVECVERGLDPLTTNLVVADAQRSEKTICLAVSPTMKAHGVPSRPRLFEVISIINKVNLERRYGATSRKLDGASFDDRLVRRNPSLAVDYITATPRMALYIEYSTKIYGVYLKFFAPEDIHVYSIDEVFIDATHYLRTYKKTPRELAAAVIYEVLRATGITATAGIGTNLYLAKVAMDIVAKRMSPDRYGVRIAELDEMSYRELLWEHRPLTDFWRVGGGYQKKLESHGIYTMGDVALTSKYNEGLLYKLFGINAELLIDHAWGWEPCTIADIKSYRPSSKSLNSGQVLREAYTYDRARLIVREMADLLALDMVDKDVKTKQLTLTVGYDAESLEDDTVGYVGELVLDHYGRIVPKSAHGCVNFRRFTSSPRAITEGALAIFDRTVNPRLLVRRVNISVALAGDEGDERDFEQLNMFDSCDKANERDVLDAFYERERARSLAVISIRKKYGSNAILKGMNFEEGAMTVERNMQIGGHRA